MSAQPAASGAGSELKVVEPKGPSAWQRVRLRTRGCSSVGGELHVAGSVGQGGFHTEQFEFVNRFQVADNSGLLVMSEVITSLFVARWQYVIKLPQLQN